MDALKQDSLATQVRWNANSAVTSVLWLSTKTAQSCRGARGRCQSSAAEPQGPGLCSTPARLHVVLFPHIYFIRFF